MISYFRRIVPACRYALKGLRSAFKEEAAFRSECFILLLAVPSAFFISHTVWGRFVLIASVLWVMVVELLNSAIEALGDFAEQRAALIGRAKDMGSAAVLLSVLICAGVWLIALWGVLQRMR